MIVIDLLCDGIMDNGTLIEIEILPSFDFIKSNCKYKQDIPSIKTTALIDTGAGVSCIDETIVESLPLLPCVTKEVKTPFHTTKSNFYQVIFKIFGEKKYFPVITPQADFSSDIHKAIIGRDILKYCTLIYDGVNEKAQLIIQNRD